MNTPFVAAVLPAPSDPPTFCKDECNSDCRTDDELVAAVTLQDPPTFCEDECNSDCKTDCVETDDVLAQALLVIASQDAYHKVMDADLSLVVERLHKEGEIDARLIDSAVVEYRRFMGLIAKGNRGVSMISKTVDAVWHAHILHTRDYADFCQAVFGRFIHHAPHNSVNPAMPGAGSRFIQLYAQEYGTLPAIWRNDEPQGYCDVH